jgi:hypothetical protein
MKSLYIVYMKYLKRIFESTSEANDIKEILTDLMDLDIIDSIGKMEIVNFGQKKGVEIRSKLKKNISVRLVNNLGEFGDLLETLSKIKTALDQMEEISNFDFSFGDGSLSIIIKPNSKFEKLLEKIPYEIPQLKLDFSSPNKQPRLGLNSFIVNDDFSCTLIIKASSWEGIKLVNGSPIIQDRISSEFDQYGFKFVRKWHDPDWSLDGAGHVMWFEFFTESIF